MRKFSLVAVMIGLLFALPAAAQAPPAPAAPDAQTRVRGTIEKFDGETLTIGLVKANMTTTPAVDTAQPEPHSEAASLKDLSNFAPWA